MNKKDLHGLIRGWLDETHSLATSVIEDDAIDNLVAKLEFAQERWSKQENR